MSIGDSKADLTDSATERDHEVKAGKVPRPTGTTGLKVGENVFCTSQKNPDDLCFAHSTITALLNLDSVRYAASLTGGTVGEALTKLCLSPAEPERRELVRRLTSEVFDETEMLRPQGQDAAVFMRRLLQRLHSEACSEDHVFSCIVGESCGEMCRTVSSNCPDAFVEVNECRRDAKTYRESAKAPYDVSSRGDTVYKLKFCLVHLGRSPSGGHFVTFLTNPLDREQCVRVDGGEVRRIKREDFEKLAGMSYLVGYERIQSIPSADVSKHIDARRREITRQTATEEVALSKGLVFGTGLRPEGGLLKYSTMTETKNAEGERVFTFTCLHCDAVLSKEKIKEHVNGLRWERWDVLRGIDKDFRITPRQIARGTWSNDRLRLIVRRRHDRGNATEYAWQDGQGSGFSCIVRTTSTWELEREQNWGEKTDDGFCWYGRGYSSQNKDHLLAAKEEIMYEDMPDEGYQNFPVWSLLGRVYDVQGWRKPRQEETRDGVANLDFSDPAYDPLNRKFLHEFEIILVASAPEGKPFKLVLRRSNLADEELTHFEALPYGDEERPSLDSDILDRLKKHKDLQYVTKAHRAPSEPSYEAFKGRGPFKFKNEGQLLCWVNSAVQVLFHVDPNIGTELRRVLQQPSHLSGPRDVPKMLWEILTRPGAEQSLESLRRAVTLSGREGSALIFFEELVEILNRQAPATVDIFAGERRLLQAECPCPAEGCDERLSASERHSKKEIVQFPHMIGRDGLSSQNSVDRKLVEQSRTCRNGHETYAIRDEVSIVKMPEVFLVPVPGSRLEQRSSMEVEYGGATYRAEAAIHHIPPATDKGVGHHYCSLFDWRNGKWQRIDDFHGRERDWKQLYRFDETQQAFRVPQHKLFENLGVVFYKRIRSEGAGAATDTANFHTYTSSGQQVLLAANLDGNGCYAIATFAMLLSNPHIHFFFRNLPTAGASRLELFLRGLSRQPDRSVAWNIGEGRLSVYEELLRMNPASKVEDFSRAIQQDAEEFLTRLLEAMRAKDVVADDGSVVLRAPLSGEHRRNFVDILGYTSVFETVCTEQNCTRYSSVRTDQEFVLSVAICGGSVNECIREDTLKTTSASGECHYCGKKDAIREHTQKDFRLKKVVIVQLKRFDGQNNKIDRPVTVDVVLTEGPFSGYLLTGAVLHRGNTVHGHYTSIARDFEDGTWVKTSDDTGHYLREETAARELAEQGYIFVYSSGQFPPALKSIAEKKTPKHAKKGTEQRTRFGCRPQKSTFKIREAGDPVSLPQMPAAQNLTSRRRILTPTAREIAEKLEMQTDASSQRQIDPSDPLAAVLRRFGHEDFRSAEQLAAVREVINGVNDVLVIMSTGEERFSFFLHRAIRRQRQVPHLPTAALGHGKNGRHSGTPRQPRQRPSGEVEEGRSGGPTSQSPGTWLSFPIVSTFFSFERSAPFRKSAEISRLTRPGRSSSS